MIDVLINRHTGIPIAAKPAGSNWSARETDGPDLCVVVLGDPPAEVAARATGVAANPFAEYAVDPTTKLPRMLRQSTIRLRTVVAGATVKMTDMEPTDA